MSTVIKKDSILKELVISRTSDTNLPPSKAYYYHGQLDFQ